MTKAKSASEFDYCAILRPGDHVAWPQGTGEPTGLTAALASQAAVVPPIRVVLGMVTTRTLDLPGMLDLEFLCFNGAANTRKAVAASRNRVIPAHLSAIPELIRTRRVPVDVALIRVRPTPDPNVFSLGVVVDFVREMIAAARVVVAEIDERMPLTGDDALIDRSTVTHWVEADAEQPEIADARPAEADLEVARRVAAIIPDRATVQFGVGGMPVAVAKALKDHKDLGLHSGVIPDAVVDLVEAGVITNAHKGIDEGVSVTGGLFGTRRLFDFAHENRALAMRGVSYTHNASTLARLNSFHTVNSAIAIDLGGQVNAEVAGNRYLGAVGGQVDFVRGGHVSPGGRSIIAMASTTADGKHSKILPSLHEQPVTTARSDIDIVVTEFGVAELWGLDLQARAQALIAIAHPSFRDALAEKIERV